MGAPVDPDQKWLLNCLTATLDTSRDVRSFAEASLQQASLQPGFGAALAKVTVNKEIPFGLRQLAAVLLKQFIKQHWREDEEGFIHPVVSAEEKGAIRQFLLPSLNDPHGKIRTAVGMAVATIAQYDWPEEWPELLPFLLKLISDQNNRDGVRGSLRCLALLSGDLDDMLVPKLAPILFPYLHTVISSTHLYDKSLRAKALSIFHSCITVLGSMRGVYKTETRDLMMPMLKSLTEEFTIILQPPLQADDPADWSIRMEVLKCLVQFVQNFASLIEAEFAVIAAPLWQTLVSSLEVYQRSSIQGSEDPHSGRYDSDGTENSLESFVVQLFELLLTIVGNHRLGKVIEGGIKELVYHTIAFLQMTEEQVHTWSIDANQYVADEDDVTYSCRVSGSLLLEEIVNAYGREGIDALVEAVHERLSESSQSKITGSLEWWRLREASLFAMGSLSEQLVEVQNSGLTKYNTASILEQVLTEDLGTGFNECPFLHARAFSMVAKFSSVISRNLSEKFLSAAIQSLSIDVLPPVKVGACHALSQLLPDCNPDVIRPHMQSLFSSLTDLLEQASDETLHLVLETLQAAVKAGHEQLASMEPVLSPIILNVWVQHVSDPFISIDTLDVLAAIKDSPGCVWPLFSRILPSIRCVLEKPQVQPIGLVSGSLDLLTMMLKGSPLDILKAGYDVCFNLVVQIILGSNDNSEMQNATECLAAFVSGGKQELLGWGGDPRFTMKRLLDAASRLLDPDLESSGSLFVGSYILQLILHLPSQMAPHIHELVAAIVRRMQSSEIASLKSSLIVIIARLVHLSVPNVDHFINLLLTVPAEGHENSFSYIMSEWTKQQGEIQGVYQIKITTTALALLFSTHHTELTKVYVQGNLIKSNAGIITRSKARSAPEQWTVIPLAAKIFALLSDNLIEIQEQIFAEDDEDSDWEEASHSDGGLPQDILYSASAPTNARPSIHQLDAMAKVFDESEDDNNEADLYRLDPLNEINLADHLKRFFVELSKSDRLLFDHFCQSLTTAQRKAVDAVLR